MRAHVGLNLVFLVPSESGGMEAYARELIEALVAEAPDLRLTAFVNREAARAGGGPWNELVPAITVPVEARNRSQWVRGEQQLLPRLARRAGVDLVHSLGSTASAWGRFRRVSTIHDLQYRTVPEAHFGLPRAGDAGPGAALGPPGPSRDRRLPRGPRRAPLAAAPAAGQGRRGAARVRRAAPRRAVGHPELRRRLGVDDGESIALSVSAKRPHKNLMALLDALALIEPGRRPVLVLPGYPTEHEVELRERAASSLVAPERTSSGMACQISLNVTSTPRPPASRLRVAGNDADPPVRRGTVVPGHLLGQIVRQPEVVSVEQREELARGMLSGEITRPPPPDRG